MLAATVVLPYFSAMTSTDPKTAMTPFANNFRPPSSPSRFASKPPPGMTRNSNRRWSGWIPQDKAFPAVLRTSFSQEAPSEDRQQEKTASQRDSELVMVLIKAAEVGDTRRIEELLIQGVDIDDSVKPDRRSALHVAAFCGHAAVVTQLLDAGADWQHSDVNGSTALDL